MKKRVHAKVLISKSLKIKENKQKNFDSDS